MKKLCLALVLALMLSALPALAETADRVCGEFTYILLKDGTARITAWSGKGEELTVPEELDGYPVTSIAASALAGCETLTDLTLPRSLTDIEEGTLDAAPSLQTFYAPLESWAEEYCQAHELYVTPPTIACGDYEYALLADGTAAIASWEGDYEKKMELVVPDKLDGHAVTRVLENAFHFHDNVTALTLPEGLRRIESYAFEGFGMETLTLPEGLEFLGDRAFCYNESLKSVSLPASLASIENNPFVDCPMLETLELDPENEHFEVIDGALFQKEGGVLICYPGALEETDFAVPEGTVRIGESAFSGCTTLESVTLPETVTAIGDSAFYGCAGLWEIRLPGSLTELGGSAFYDCAMLGSIDVPAGVERIPEFAFGGCEGLTSVSLPEGLKSIAYSAFIGCEALETLALPDSLRQIEGSAFYGCSKLAEIDIPEGVVRLLEGTFADCAELARVSLPDSLQSIEGAVFEGCTSLKTVEISPDHPVYQFEDGMLITRQSRTLVCCLSGVVDGAFTVPEDVRRIGDSAFYGISTMTSLTVPEGVTGIGAYSFAYCEGLEEVALPQSLARIGDNAFTGCSMLKSVELPEGLKTLGTYVFSGCESLEEAALPQNLNGIPDGLFAECRVLRGVELPEGLTRIGDCAFFDCEALEEIGIPEGVTAIDNSAFSCCLALKSLTLPEGLERVGEFAFSGCGALTSLNLFINVNEIGEDAFEDCPNLTVTVPQNSYAGDWCRRNGVSTVEP